MGYTFQHGKVEKLLEDKKRATGPASHAGRYHNMGSSFFVVKTQWMFSPPTCS
jgi:hypothetical protein